MNPLVFLDVDGVLAPHRNPGSERGISRECCSLLWHVASCSGCSMVVSSAWRYSGTGRDSVLGQCLRAVGYDMILLRVIDMTPLELDGPEDRDTNIRRYIETHDMPDRWIAIDDLECIRNLGAEHAVVTDGAVGLTLADAKMAIGLLRGER